MAYMKDSTGRRLDSFQVKQFQPVMQTAVLGDSIDADTLGWWPTACALTEQRMRHLYNGGVGGDTTTMALARIGNVINQTPDVCIIGGGITNDIAQGFTTTTTRNNLTAMVAQLRAAGITPLFRNCPPRGAATSGAYNTDALAIAAVLDHNAWVDSYAASEGIEVFDIYTPLADPVTKMMLLENSDDASHPNRVGSLKAARAFRDNLPQVFADAAPFDLTTQNMGTRVKNPLFIANAAGQATDWANGSGFTTKDVSTKAPAGNWQHYTKTDSAWALTSQQVPVPPGTAITIGFRAAVTLGAMVVSYRFKDAANVAVGSTQYTTIRTPSTTAEGAVYIIKATSPVNGVSMEILVQNQTDGLGPAVDFSIAQFTVSTSDK